MLGKLLIALVVAWLAWRLWRGTGYGRPGQPIEDRDRAAARRLLGVARDADETAIRAAHRRLVADAHPDRGGSEDEARRLNAARDLLISRDG